MGENRSGPSSTWPLGCPFTAFCCNHYTLPSLTSLLTTSTLGRIVVPFTPYYSYFGYPYYSLLLHRLLPYYSLLLPATPYYPLLLPTAPYYPLLLPAPPYSSLPLPTTLYYSLLHPTAPTTMLYCSYCNTLPFGCFVFDT